MRCYKQTDTTGKILAIGKGPGGTEITEAEYNRLKAEITAIAEWVNRVYTDPAQAEQVPAEWKTEVLRQVEQRKQWEAAAEAADVTPEELEAARAAYEEGVNNA